MAIEQRRHIRFSLDIPAVRDTKLGERRETLITQISIGGCLAGFDPSIYVGDEFRLLVPLPNKNFLPLAGKAIYIFPDSGIGTKFLDITQFEQELLARTITHALKEQGLPMQVDPFAAPRRPSPDNTPRLTNPRQQQDDILENILSGGGKYPL